MRNSITAMHHMQHLLYAGGDSGIGREAASALAAAQGHVIVANQNREKAAAAVQRIKTETPDAKVEAMHLDLASFRCAKACCDGASSRPLAHQQYTWGSASAQCTGWPSKLRVSSKLQQLHLSASRPSLAVLTGVL